MDKVMMDLGCWSKKKKGHYGVDMKAFDGVDVMADLTKQFPFSDNSVDGFYSHHFMEHINTEDFIFCMEEIHRVSKPGANVIISVPYETYRGAQFPMHKQVFNTQSFCIFEPWREYHGDYTNASFNILKITFWFGKQGIFGALNNVMEKIANRFPNFYEFHLRYLFPPYNITYELEVDKSGKGKK